MKAKLGIGYDNANGKKSNEATNLKASSEKKWTRKRKASINCAKPKGFSERAYCAGKRKSLASKKSSKR